MSTALRPLAKLPLLDAGPRDRVGSGEASSLSLLSFAKLSLRDRVRSDGDVVVVRPRGVRAARGLRLPYVRSISGLQLC